MSHAPGAAAERCGVTLATLRYYESQQIIGPISRDSSGRRRYSDDDLAWIGIATCLRDAGLGIDNLRRFATLLRDESATGIDRVEFLRRRRTELQQEQANISRALAVLEEKIDFYRAAERS